MSKEPEEGGFTVIDRRGRREAPEPAAAPSSAQASRPEGAPAGPASAPLEVDLTTLFLMLASSAMVSLGHTADPATGAPRRDLAQVRLTIELLRLLRDKTEGHRSAEESQLLEQILYELQVQFVEATEGRG